MHSLNADCKKAPRAFFCAFCKSCYTKDEVIGLRKAYAVGFRRHVKKDSLRYSLEELKNLAGSLGIDVIRTFTQSSEQITPAYKVGTGKLEEMRALLEEESIDYVIFDEELTNTQIRNLEEVLDVAIIDRTLLILETFAKRAKTKEAMLQVEIAQLKYLKPRLTSMRTSFAQQQGGIGQRGPGEKKLELDRRKIDRDINNLEHQLKNITRTRKSNRRRRKLSPIKNVAIVGYTNAGKSTLMNALLKQSKHGPENKSVAVEDRLFATLETATRQIRFKERKPFTLTDTIGFISKLPHELVESFKATLEEISEADLLLHVVDFSHPYYLDQVQTTEKVLEEIGVEDVETLYVFNKIDLNNAVLPPNFQPAIKVSLKDGTNLDTLVETINEMLFRDDAVIVYSIPQDKGEIVHMLNEYAEILDKEYENNTVRIRARVSKPLREDLRPYELRPE